MAEYKVIQGECLEILKKMKGNTIQCCITSPPYYGLRDYQVDNQIGLEKTPEEYISKLVEVFREVRRVLRDDGTLWLNIGDSYNGSGKAGKKENAYFERHTEFGKPSQHKEKIGNPTHIDGLKPKDLIGIPWMLAFALRTDGWYLRQDIIWCLSGGTWLYARTQKGDMPVMVRDLARLKPETVQLWNGKKWTPLLGMNKNKRRGDELEIVLRSGERISCTPTHRFPTNRGLLDAEDIRAGDILTSCQLPEPETVKDCMIDEDAAWFAGLYVAEGSKAGDTIQIAGNVKETERWERVQRIVAKFGGAATRTVDGNKMNIRVYGKVLNAIIDELTTGRIAKNKGFATVSWRYSNRFIEAMMDGYLSGDGGKDGNRWRLGFTRNYNLERDLRTACARLGWKLTLNPRTVPYDGRAVPIFRGEIRKYTSDHRNTKDRNEVVEIRKARCREVYDLGVADEPHLFALASGVLSHNSKPNPMPESVRDRCTKSHEYIFLLSKSKKYYFDYKAIQEPAVSKSPEKESTRGEGYGEAKGIKNNPDRDRGFSNNGYRNKRSVWFINTKPYKGAHFATFPPELIRPCIKAGSKEGDIILDPFAGSGTTGQVALEEERNTLLIELNPEYIKLIENRLNKI